MRILPSAMGNVCISALPVVITCMSAPATASDAVTASPFAPAGARDEALGTPPGAPPYTPELSRKLAAARDARGAGYVPRTHHLAAGGGPKYTNRLILESSPYLIQHAHNPVDWYPWGDEAFALARDLDRPIILSVGYSTCHWCHVMERESFEDVEIARFMNEHFISVKVDREERPDIDGVYMSAVRAMGINGGWPMTVVMSPDGKPFFGGTYFPPRRGERGARQGFLEILRLLETQYRINRNGVLARAGEISAEVARSLSPLLPGDIPGPHAIAAAAHSLANTYDPVHGGFGTGNKFPRPVSLQLLLRYHRRTADPLALEMVSKTLERMAAGGIHDQIGGGFHRYTVEPTWLVPHFEKMLYDNAQLAVVYLEAFQVTKRDDFARVARRTLDYVGREMTDPAGGFYSATDADSPSPSGHDEEGLFFTWTPDEIRALLPAPLASLVIDHYGVTTEGNFEGRSILHVARPIAGTAAVAGPPSGGPEPDPDGLRARIDEAREVLYEARRQRRPPHTDTKILTAWNGLMISAFARGAQVLDEPSYARRAETAALFILSSRTKQERLVRSTSRGKPGPPAVLADYAFLIASLLDLYETTFEPGWIEEAVSLQTVLDRHFRDPESGGYFMTADDAETLLAREKPYHDGAEPSGNAVTVMNLLRLHELTERAAYRTTAERAFAAFSRVLSGTASAVPYLLAALDYYHDQPKEIVLVGTQHIDETALFLRVMGGAFLPNRVAIATTERDARTLSDLVPLAAHRIARDGRPTAYVCENRICKLPTTDPEVFARQIGDVAPYPGGGLAPLTVPRPPRPWEFDKPNNRHWNPEHRHWHQGPPPAGGAGKGEGD